MKYKVGDRVRIKSLDWYNENKTIHGDIWFDNAVFVGGQSLYCGCELTIRLVINDSYYVIENDYYWTDEMIEGLVEEESEKKLSDESWKPSKEEMDVLYSLAYITNKYDEHKEEVITRLYQDLKREFFNGSSYENMFPNTENDVRRRSTIQVLEYARSLDNYNQYGKADIDKNIAWLEKQSKSALEARTDNELVEEEILIERVDDNGLPFNEWLSHKGAFYIPDGYELKDENGNVINAQKIVLEKKKKRYPKTYEECYKIMGAKLSDCYIQGYKSPLLEDLQELLICRDAYWKIAGDEMGLGKPWELSIGTPIYYIYYNRTVGTIKNDYADDIQGNIILAFPTKEMRDAFYDNFKELIESCKELL